MLKQLFTFCIATLLSVVTVQVLAQQRVDTLQAGKKLNILFADRMNFQKIDSATQLISLAGNVKVSQGKTLFYADSAVLNQVANTLESFGRVHINDADSIHTYADYLKYLGKEKKAYLKRNVRLTDGRGVLTTDELEYDVNTKIGTYVKGGKVVNGKTVLTSKEASYFGETRDIYFKNKVVLIDPGYKIYTDTLLYNTYTDIATFVSPTKIITDTRTIKTKDGYYDLRKKKAYFGKRPVIEDSSGTIIANEVAFEDSTGLAEFRGDVVYKGKDTAQGFDLIANKVETNRKKGSLLATQAPLLLIKQGKDSVFIRADTLYTAKLSDLLKEKKVPNLRDTVEHSLFEIAKNDTDSSSDKFFEAYAHVRIFSDSLQAVGDSLFYSLKDSVFRLFKNPVTWSQENQLTGDTIYLYLKNKQPEKIRVFENAMAISDATGGYFNQVIGKTINAFFVDGKMNYLRSKGNPAESVYYGVDDYGKFFGVNKAASDVIDMYFADGKPDKVVFRNKLEGTTYPMRQVNHEAIKVKGFQWLENKRPKSKFEILSN
jgi:lipopolysaccharide export system protein LptA